jgi:predicted permease
MNEREEPMISELKTFTSRIKAMFSRRREDEEFSDEIREHLDMLTEENVRRGMPLAEARREAKIRLGGAAQLRETHRELTGVPFLETFFQDVRYAVRMLRKNPGFTAIAVLTLALGIGANAAIFSVVDAVLLRSLPFKNASRLVDITEYKAGEVDSTGVPFPDYLVWKQQNTVFSETAAYFLISASNDIVLGGPFSAERERYSAVTNSFFSTLGVYPALGHGFASDDEKSGGPKVFVVSNSLWRGLLGGDPHVIGKAFVLDGENYTLVGVMPPGFDFPKACGVWVSTSTLNEFGIHDRTSHPYHVLGRLRSETNLSQAVTQIQSIQDRLAKAYPTTDTGWQVQAQPLLDEIIGNVRTSLLVLLGAVGFILLIACTNVVNLMLARASVREKEFAVRAALGAGRMRLLRQSLTESLLIVGISAIIALALAKWGLALIVSLTQIYLPRMEAFRLSLPMLAFISTIAALVTFIVGIAPALQLSQQQPQSALCNGERGGFANPRSRRLRSILVTSEVAFAILLLCGAGLMLRSFVQLNRVNPGFQTEHLLTFKTALPGATYSFRDTEKRASFYRQLLDRLQSVPGVQDAAATTTVPLNGESDWGRFEIEERPAQDWDHAPLMDGGGSVSLNYFRTLGIRLLRGREFTETDAQNQNTIIINEAMARKFWPDGDPLGQHIVGPNRSHPREIIGILVDFRDSALDRQSKPEMYTPFSSQEGWYMNFVVRTAQDPASIVSALRRQVAAIDKGVPVYQVATMDQLLNRSLAPQRFDLFLLGLFAALALILAAIGIYGVLSFGVTQRTHEIGLRIALGAHPRDIFRLIIREAIVLVLVGVTLGVAASVVLTRFMAALLFDVGATDPVTFVGVAVLLLLVTLAACYIPARRAMRTDPIVALRYE